jgi:hypothetical protein
MTRREDRELARELRRQGKSFSEIRKVVPASKGTLSYWLKGIELTEEQKKNLPKSSTAGPKGGQKNKEKWEKRRQEVKDHYDPPLNDPRFMLGLALYWGEGSKYSKSVVQFTNSDADMLLVFLKWTERYFCHTEVRVRVQHHSPKTDDAVKQLWSERLGVSLEKFTQSTFLVPSEIRKRMCDGIVRITLVGKDVWVIRQKIEKAIEISKKVY